MPERSVNRSNSAAREWDCLNSERPAPASFGILRLWESEIVAKQGNLGGKRKRRFAVGWNLDDDA